MEETIPKQLKFTTRSMITGLRQMISMKKEGIAVGAHLELKYMYLVVTMKLRVQLRIQ